jgi:hypothetical protein
MAKQATALRASEIINQAWEMLVPKGRWIKEEWLRRDFGMKDGDYFACSMGAMLLVEHLAGITTLGLSSERDSDDSDSEDWGDSEFHDFEGTIRNLKERDPEFAVAVNYVATAVVAYVTEANERLKDEPQGEFDVDDEVWDLEYVQALILVQDDVEIITNFNDNYRTTQDDIDKVFQLAYRNAQAAETA